MKDSQHLKNLALQKQLANELKESELQNYMKVMDLSKICNKRNAILKKKYENLRLSDKEIEYRIY